MQDTIIKWTGNSRSIKAPPDLKSRVSSLDDLLDLFIAGFACDFGPLNPAGVQRIGTELNKANLLKDETAARYGLPATAVPDDVFNKITPTVGSIANIVSGNYVGTGTSNFELNIGFRPKIVLISQYSIYSIGVEIGIFIDDCRGLKLVLSNAALTTAVIPVGWTDSGLVIGDATSGVHLNYPEAPYHYVAIK